MIVATVRTRDEERNIESFCRSYQGIADKILVADGGSLDNTIEIASSFRNVEIRNFPGRTPMQNGHWRNNDSAHINYLINWAKEYEPDWIIHDDCDCRPNYLLRVDARHILEETEENVVMTVRVYMYGKDQHFPHMTRLKPPTGDNYMTSLWAWQPFTNLWTYDLPPAYTLMIEDEVAGDLHKSTDVRDLMPPYCLLHHTWDNEERVEQKIKVYRESGLIPGQLHPKKFAGPLEPLPEWAHE